MPSGRLCHANAVHFELLNNVDSRVWLLLAGSHCDRDCGLWTAFSVSVNQLTARHGTSLAMQFVVSVSVARLTMWVVRCEGPDSDRHLSNKSIIRVKHINTSEMLLVVTWLKKKKEKCKWEAASRKKPKLNYPMFTISLQILTLALHSNTHTHIRIQIHLHNHNHIQAAASFKSFIRCTHNTNANKAPCQIKRSKRHPSWKQCQRHSYLAHTQTHILIRI